MREPESQFISSFNFYHNLMPRFTRLLNPTGLYHRYEKVKGMKAQSRPTKQDIELEMTNFLSKPWEVLQDNFPTNAFAWMLTIRPQLLFYGKSPKGVESFDENLEREDVIEWIKRTYSHNRPFTGFSEFSFLKIINSFCQIDEFSSGPRFRLDDDAR